MKRGMLSMMILMLLLWAMHVFPTQAKAAEVHTHCVCGGSADGIGDHACTQTATWQPWDGTDSLLDGGCYYLNDTDGDGVITLSKTLVIEKKNVSLCLNGVELTCEGRTINVNGVKSGTNYLPASLNICDCQGSGSITSTSTAVAPVLHSYTSNRGEATINLYSGHLIAKDKDAAVDCEAGVLRLGNNTGDSGSASHHKATFRMYGGSISGGMTKKTGGNVYISTDCAFYLYGGRVEGGQATGNGGNFFVSGLLDLQGGTVTGGSANQGGGIYVHSKGILTVGGTVQVKDNKVSNVYLPTGKLLTAQKLTSANVGVTSVNAVFAQADSAEAAGSFYCDQTGYTVAYGEGQLSRIASPKITMLSIQPSVVGIGYKAQFTVPENLRSHVEYGFDLWLDGYPVHTYVSQKALEDTTQLSLRLQNIMTADNDLRKNLENGDTDVLARAYILLDDGRRLESGVEAYDLRKMLETVDTFYSTFTDEQTEALQSMYTDYKAIMLGWDLPNIIHNSGTWTDLDAENFASLIGKSGQYQLVSDVDLGEKTLFINANTTVTLCLNGYTLSGSSCLFRVYGTFNLCDCHAEAQEGTMTSSLSGEDAKYAPVAYIHPGTMNLYGGNLTATGKVPSGGVIIAGCGTLNGVSGVPGTLQMFGGRIYGGQVYKDGGLITLWDGSVFTMYGGALYNGTADRDGGAVHVNGGRTANLYGGRIYQCTAGGNGGGVCVSSKQSNLHLGKLTLENNTADQGGNVYHVSDTALTVDGSTVTGGKAVTGGGIYVSRGDIMLSGKAVIRDNENGSLYMTAASSLNADNLETGADVRIYNMSSMALETDMRYISLEREGYTVTAVGGRQVLIPESFEIPGAVEGFQVGFGRSDITPTETELPMSGYGNAASRLSTTTAQNAYDALKVSCTAITDEDGETVLLISVDLIRPDADLMTTILPAVSAATGVPESRIFTTFTHTHSAPETNSVTNQKIRRYNAMLPDRFAESASLAMADRACATMQTGSFEVDGLNFTRHYKYQDLSGNWHYFGDNFGSAPTDLIGKLTIQHATEADRTMHLVQFTREGTDILLANWRVHPHMTGGSTKTAVSADIIGTTRYYFENDRDCHFMYLQGAAGNINESSRISSEQHGLSYDQYGQELAQQMHTAMTNGCLTDAAPGLWQVDHCDYNAVADISTQEEYDHAVTARNTYNTWLQQNPEATSAEKREKLEELGYQSTYHINNVITRHSYTDKIIPLNACSLGNSLAFYTAPGELWDTVSMELEEASPFDMTLCLGYSQDYYNYFVYDPNNGGQLSYESYEGNNYRFVAPNTINDMIAYWKSALSAMYTLPET